MTRKIWLYAGVTFIILVATNAATYWTTREKWYDLGVISGFTSGKAHAVELFAPYATTGKWPADLEFQLTVKASSLGGKRIDGGVALFYAP